MSPTTTTDAELHHERALLYLERGRYGEAHEDLRVCCALTPLRHSRRDDLFMEAGRVAALAGRFADAIDCYGKVAGEKTLARTALRAARHELRAREKQVHADDDRLRSIVLPMLAAYPLLKKPLHLLWIDRDPASLAVITAIEDRFRVAAASRVRAIAWDALSHFPASQQHFIFLVRDMYFEADESALRGVLAHELCHEEWKEADGTSFVPSPASSGLAFVCNERITDLCAVSKGFGRDLLRTRIYKEERTGGSMALSGVLAPDEIRRLIDSELFLRQEALWQTRFAQDLTARTGNNALSRMEWDCAARLWHDLLGMNPASAEAMREEERARRAAEIGTVPETGS